MRRKNDIMTGDDHYNLVNEEKICPECGLHAPKRQIENLEMCERCSLEGKVKTKEGKTRNPEVNLLDKWKLETPTKTAEIRSEGAT